MSWIVNINALTPPEKEGLYRQLVPPSLFPRLGISPLRFHNAAGERCVRFYCPMKDHTTLIEVKRNPDDADCVFSYQISDTQDHTKLNWDFIIVNDPDSERFDTDVDADGKDTLFGSANRNLIAEQAAMEAGLFPGQTQSGLKIMGEFLPSLTAFCRMLGVKSIGLEALFYHNAIQYERYGFSYFEGFKRMKRIHDLFQEGQVLQRKMDGSTPFRAPGGENTVHGRSWAIHDGILEDLDDPILDEPWYSPEMYTMIDKPRAMVTFPDPVWK